MAGSQWNMHSNGAASGLCILHLGARRCWPGLSMNDMCLVNSGQVVEVLTALWPQGFPLQGSLLSLTSSAGKCVGDHTRPKHDCCCRYLRFLTSDSLLVAALPATHASVHPVSLGYQHIRMYDLNSNNPNPIISYDGVNKNIASVGFHEDGRWMYTGGEDCTARIWDLRWCCLLGWRGWLPGEGAGQGIVFEQAILQTD